MVNPVLEAALKYRALGLSVLPVGRDKKPLLPWADLQKRLPTNAEIKGWYQRWPDAGVGIVTGPISGLAVLDIDPRNGGDKSLFSSEEYIIPVCPTGNTGGGGTHHFFRDDGALPTCPGLLPGVDLKAAGGYVVVPPSLHPSGRAYVWDIDLLTQALPDRPEWIANLVKNRPHQANIPLPETIPGGLRNDTMFKLGASLRHKGLSKEGIIAALMVENKRCNPPLSEAEIENIAASASRYAPGELPKSRPISPPAEYKNTQLRDIICCFQEFLFLPDTAALELVLGAVAANMLPGDPVWLLLVGPAGYGKTEILNCITKLPAVHQIAVLTEASLLSGTPKKDANGAKGGLLKEMGAFGILTIKDFGGVLSLSRETRGPILAGLREVYDGSWVRYVGSDGGRALAWQGKAGLIGGSTPSIDSYYAVISALGERFIYYRIPESTEDDKSKAALAHMGEEGEIRNKLSLMVAGFFSSLDLKAPPRLSEDETAWLISLARFTARCRSPIERETYSSREITLIPGAESPTRLVKCLCQLLYGLLSIGIPRARALELVGKVGLDSMPAIRRKVISALLEHPGELSAPDLAATLDYPTSTTRRTLEDLTAYGLIRRNKAEFNRDLWSATPLAQELAGRLQSCIPEILTNEILEKLYSVSSISDTQLETERGENLFWFLPSGRQVGRLDLLKRWEEAGRPAVPLSDSALVSDLAPWLTEDTDIEDLALVVAFLEADNA